MGRMFRKHLTCGNLTDSAPACDNICICYSEFSTASFSFIFTYTLVGLVA